MEEFIRLCPTCGKKVKHKNTQQLKIGLQRNRPCITCANEIKRPKYLGAKNHFYGKHHSNVNKVKLSLLNKGKHTSPSTEFKKGNKSGGCPFIYWKEKYPQKEFLQKMNFYRKKQSVLSSGKNNGMYGKPSPKGSGNGWSGWYKNWFFRSINELSYFIQVIERFKLNWMVGEQTKYRVNYIDLNGTPRTYFSDFIINEKYMVECKPRKLWNSKIVKLKKKAAEEFCHKHNMKYKLVECSKISMQKIKLLKRKKSLNFTSRYEQKFKDYYSDRASGKR